MWSIILASSHYSARGRGKYATESRSMALNIEKQAEM